MSLAFCNVLHTLLVSCVHRLLRCCGRWFICTTTIFTSTLFFKVLVFTAWTNNYKGWL